ncbi:MAG: hypothetical protein R3255_11435, partial [Candidatus Lokiarchaeia archaeon]|nr:hypothetical protein [Candidatus Lokiarchaeia archaeon]
LITFAFSLFFRILSSGKLKTEFTNSIIIYNPLGLEKKSANRLFYCTLFQLILIFWIGSESLYDSHIVQNYYSFFLGFLVFLYTFSFFWIFTDSWKYTKIEIIDELSKDNSISLPSGDEKKILTYLSLQNIKFVAYITFLIFISINILNILMLFITNYTNIGMQVILPGSQILTISYLLFGFLFISPSIAVFILIKNYKIINKINKKKLENILESLPRNVQIKITENLKALKIKKIKQLRRE